MKIRLKKSLIFIVLFSFLITPFILFSSQTSSKNNSFYKNISPEEAEKILKENSGNIIILDVRTKEEFSEGHIKGAINIDYHSKDFKSKLEKLDKTKIYMIYCRSGYRSGRAFELMKEMGFTKLYNIEGGINAWIGEGLPVAK